MIASRSVPPSVAPRAEASEDADARGESAGQVIPKASATAGK